MSDAPEREALTLSGLMKKFYEDRIAELEAENERLRKAVRYAVRESQFNGSWYRTMREMTGETKP